ncbi:MAG: glycosyltransferase family 4 protein [Elusimicrobia bacterium]|nr:glycosyltransferase family 4 protein [Elusimicrobiota bacterium]
MDPRPVEDVTVSVGFALRNFSLMTGVSRCVSELARRLPAHGFEPVVFANRLPKGAVRKLDGSALPTCFVPWIPFTSKSRAASFDWVARKLLASRGAQLIHGEGDLTRQDVLTVNNCDAAAARYVPDGRSPSAGVEYVRKAQFSPDGSRIILAVSDRVRRDLSEFYGVPPEKVRRVYLGVDADRFHPNRREPTRATLLKQAGLPAETRLALMVLSGDPAKRNLSLAARAVEQLSRRAPLALCLVGNTAWREDAAACRLHERGRLLHVPPTLHVEDYFAAADVFILPAFYEEFGLTVLESLSSGCPCVVSARCGAAELIADGANGYVFSNLEDPGELIEALPKALSLRERENTCRKTAEEHSWEKHVSEVVDVYRELSG